MLQAAMLKPGEFIRDLIKAEPGRTVTAHGWVKTRRDSKGVHFVQLGDGSSFKDLQVVFPSESFNAEALEQVTTGACVAITGRARGVARRRTARRAARE